MASKYIDPTAIMQVIGCVYNTPQLLDYTDKYTIVDEDFVEPFHKIVFGAIYKLHELGAEKVTLESISDFLSSRPKSACFAYPLTSRLRVGLMIALVSPSFAIIS